MIEAHIICSSPCDIPDLGIFKLQRGEERWVSLMAAEKSRDLEKEQRKGNVRWFRKSRRMERQTPRNPRTDAAPRPPPPPFVARSRPSGERPGTASPETRVVEVEKVVERVVEVEKPVDQEALANMKAEILGDMRAEILGDMRSMIAEEVGKAAQSGIDASQLESTLESVMRRVMPAGGAGTPARGSSSETPEGPEDPLFFPTDIVDKEAKSRIAVKSEKSEETGDLDDAQALLREMKKGRGRGRTKETEEK